MLKFDSAAGLFHDPGAPQCHFGILEAGAGLLAGISAGVGSAATGLGVGAAAADAIGTGVTGALVGSGLGAGEAAITGGNIGTGALTGGLTGGAIGGAGGLLGDATGLGAAGGDALAGAGAGAAGSAITGGNPLTGALVGGAGGLATGALGSLTSSGPGVSSSGPGVSGGSDSVAAASTLGVGPAAPAGASASSISAPAGVGSPVPDLTSSAAASQLGVDTGSGGIATGVGGGASGSGGGGASGVGVGGSGPTLGGFTQADGVTAAAGGLGNTVNSFPTPPVPPALDASGNPVFDAAGSPVYGSAGSAQAAAEQLAADQGGFKAGATGAGGAPESSGGIIGKVGDFLNGPTGKLAGVAVSGAGLLKNLMTPTSIPGASNIAGLAKEASQQGSVLQSYLTSGTLPPAIQASVDAATKDGITAIKAKYAGQGIAPGSSAEVNDVARLKQNSVIQGATLADQLLQQGISESTLSGNLYNEMVQSNTALNSQTGSAITALASALAGGGTKIQIGGNQSAT